MAVRDDAWALLKAGRCPNCGAKGGKHYVPPCFGDPGFYICDRLEPGMGSGHGD